MTQEEQLKKFLDNLKSFNTVEDIPEVPVFSKEVMEQFVYPALIRHGAIPKKLLLSGRIYKGSCRNADEALWDGNQFVYERTKLGISYIGRTPHFQDENGNDMFIPIIELPTTTVIVRVKFNDGHEEEHNIKLTQDKLDRLLEFTDQKGLTFEQNGVIYTYEINTNGQ